jgi:hypothetical protein
VRRGEEPEKGGRRGRGREWEGGIRRLEGDEEKGREGRGGRGKKRAIQLFVRKVWLATLKLGRSKIPKVVSEKPLLSKYLINLKS